MWVWFPSQARSFTITPPQRILKFKWLKTYTQGESASMRNTDMDYLVNKPLPAAGISADNVRGREIVRKMNIWPRSEASRANVKFWGQSLSQGHNQPIYQQAGKGFIYFITLPIIFFAIKPRVNMVKKPAVIWWRMRFNVAVATFIKTSLVSFQVNWRKEKLKFLCWLFFLDGNNQRTDIDAGGGYCVITVRRFRPRDVK